MKKRDMNLIYRVVQCQIYGYKSKNHLNQSSLPAKNKFLQISPKLKSSADNVYRERLFRIGNSEYSPTTYFRFTKISEKSLM